MKEDDGRFFHLLRKIYRRLQGYLDSESDVEVRPVELGFSVCFRHDMDRFDEHSFDAFLRLEEEIDAPSTLFFLEGQFTRYAGRIRQLDAGKYESALHSEAKSTPACWSLFQLSRLLERGYARRLKRQKRNFRRAIGPSHGHSRLPRS